MAGTLEAGPEDSAEPLEAGALDGDTSEAEAEGAVADDSAGVLGAGADDAGAEDSTGAVGAGVDDAGAEDSTGALDAGAEDAGAED